MKKRIIISALLFIIIFAVFAFPSAAEDTPEALAERVLSYEETAPHLVDAGGIRSLYRVDRAAVAALEAEGYTVAYGAVMGIGTRDGVAVNTTRSLAVSGSAKEGYRTENPHAKAVVVYATGSPSYADGRHLDETQTAFAYTTAYAEADASDYAVGMVYTGFVAVTDQSGAQTVVYDYAENDLFGKNGAEYGNAVSPASLAEWLVNDYADDAVLAYRYNGNEVLRQILTTCHREISDPILPAVFVPIDGAVPLSKPVVDVYMLAARNAYGKPEYADYTKSIVSNYSTKATDLNDLPLAVTVAWTRAGSTPLRYVLTLATDAALTENVRTVAAEGTSVSVYNLLANTTYYAQLTAISPEGATYDSPLMTFKTADTVRWIYADGARNVRDLGGWNGLNQGLIYRGSELNHVSDHGLQITDAGVKMMTDVLGVSTDLDFRAATENGSYGTSSPLGENVEWVNYPIGNFLSAFSGSYTGVMRTFANYENYPVYMHCWGGADRTGTVALMLSGLCGVKEEDLAVDLELTSFSKFGYRYRYDNTSFLYASTLARVKSYPGATLEEKFEACFRENYGMTEAEISNIQAINTQSGAVFRLSDDARGDVFYNTQSDTSFAFSFIMRGSKAVTSVTVDGTPLDFSFDSESATLTVFGAKLPADLAVGIGEIVFDDGATLRFALETECAEKVLSSILSGNPTPLFRGGVIEEDGGLVTVTSDSGFEIPASVALLLYREGYECVSLALPRGVRITTYDTAGNSLTERTLDKGAIVSVPLHGGKVTFSSSNKTVMIMGVELVTREAAFAQKMMEGDYKAFFGTGTNGTGADGKPSLTVTSDNFTVPASRISELTALGYTHVSFSVDMTFPEGTTGCYLAIRHGGKRYERLYPALTSAEGRVRCDVTVELDKITDLQLISRVCSVDSMGRVVVESGYTQTPCTSFVITSLTFTRGGSEGATAK